MKMNKKLNLHRVGLENNSFRQSWINLWDFNEFVKMSDLKLVYLKRMFNNLFLSMWHTRPVRWLFSWKKCEKKQHWLLLKGLEIQKNINAKLWETAW